MNDLFKLPAYVGIILQRENEFLLVKRHNTDWASGQWNFPGGLLEEHETLAQAVVREAHEELGVVVDEKDLQLVHVLQVYASETNTKNILGFYFLTQHWQNNAVNNEPDRHEQVGWFSMSQFPSLTTAHAIKALQGIMSGSRYSVD